MAKLPPESEQFSKLPHDITPAAVDAFIAGDEYRLHRALNLTPWNFSPLTIDLRPLPSWVVRDPVLTRHYRLAQELRRKLEQARRQ
jgi:hypothetical protein